MRFIFTLVRVTPVAAMSLGLWASFAAAADRDADKRPNFIVILADDLGSSDLGCQGGTLVPTPHIDSIAANGARCTNGYVSGCVCAPTRAGLMTGRYQHRFGLETNPQPGSVAGENGLPTTETTLAEALVPLGYATGMFGKWHLGGKAGLRPPERGFQEYFGFLEGAHRFTPSPQVLDGTAKFEPFQNGIFRGVTNVVEKEYLTDAFTRETLSFIDRHKDEPFFIYLPYNAVHSPLDANNAYRDRVGDIGPPKLKEYAAMLVAMDDGVGKVLAKLREHAIDDQTLVFFLSDNGGAPQPYNVTNNLPLRGKKGELLEGGVRTPFLAQWLGTIPANTIVNELVIQLDIFATALALAGGKPSADRPLDGANILPLLTRADPRGVHEALFWRYNELRAVRSENWKLLKTGDAPSQLYDLASDVGETTDLSGKNPEVVARLEASLASWDSRNSDPMWPAQAPHTKNMGWLYGILGDPATASPSAEPTSK